MADIQLEISDKAGAAGIIRMETLRNDIAELLWKDPTSNKVMKQEVARKQANRILRLCKEAGLKLIL